MSTTELNIFKGRFAPSPTGRMHLGNIFTALLSWLSVKSKGGKWLLRIEDLDPQRSKIEYAKIIEDDLNWLGLHYDEGGLSDLGPNGPYRQSLRHHIYSEYLERLKESGLLYPCFCTRADLRATQAPHISDGKIIYSGKCRPQNLPNQVAFPKTPHSVRLYVPDRDFDITDLICGWQSLNLSQNCGDFVLQRADGAWAYMLAVVVDDALMGISEVVRGNDLLASTPQQIYLYNLLGFTPPKYMHVPLICNTNGIRLSKRDHALSLEHLRKLYSPDAIIGYLAYIAGLIPNPKPCTPQSLLPLFDYTKIKKDNHLIVKPSDLRYI